MLTTRLAAVLALALSFVACQPASETPASGPADLSALEEVRDRHVDAAVEGNLEQTLATYTDGVVIIPPDDPGAVGKDEARAWFRHSYDNLDIEQLEMSFDNYTLQEELAVAHYRYRWTVAPRDGGEPIRDTGQGLFVFERQPDGAWLIAYDTWSSDGAAEPSD